MIGSVKLFPLGTCKGGLLFLLLLFVTGSWVYGFDFRLTSSVDYYSGIEPSRGYEPIRSQLFLRPRFSGYLEGFDAEWVISANLHGQFRWPGRGYSGSEPSEQQADLEVDLIQPWDMLYEAYFFRPLGNFDLTVGQKRVAYGFADLFGPLNVVNSTNRAPLSLDDGFDSFRPDPMVHLQFYPTFDDTLELIYIPLSRPDKERLGPVTLPGPEGFSWPEGSSQGYILEWADEPYLLDIPHSIFLHYSRYGEKLDFQFLYAWHVDRTPDFVFSSPADLTSDNTVTPVYRRLHTVGFAYATRLGSGTFSQDIGFNLTSNFDGTDLGGKNSNIMVNSQMLMSLPWNALGQVSLVYSYFFNHGNFRVPEGAEADVVDYLAAQVQDFHTQPLEHIAFVVLHLERTFLREKLKAQLNLGFFFSPEIYLAPRLDYHLTDYWALSAGADINLGDPPEADLRRNPWDDNMYLRVLYRY